MIDIVAVYPRAVPIPTSLRTGVSCVFIKLSIHIKRLFGNRADYVVAVRSVIFLLKMASCWTHHQVNGQFKLVYGTSASAPVVGSILTMINDARLTIGKKPIGFINPTVRPFSLFYLSRHVHFSYTISSTLDLLWCFPQSVQGHNTRIESRLWHEWLHCCSRMGPCYWPWNTIVPRVTRQVAFVTIGH